MFCSWCSVMIWNGAEKTCSILVLCLQVINRSISVQFFSTVSWRSFWQSDIIWGCSSIMWSVGRKPKYSLLLTLGGGNWFSSHPTHPSTTIVTRTTTETFHQLAWACGVPAVVVPAVVVRASSFGRCRSGIVVRASSFGRRCWAVDCWQWCSGR